MPVTVTIRDGIVWFTGRGVVEPQDCIDAIADGFGKTPARLAFWDFRDCSLSGVAASSFDAIARSVTRFAGARGPGARTALCTGDVAALRLVRAFAASIGPSSPVQFQVFLGIGGALEWLRSDAGTDDQAGSRPQVCSGSAGKDRMESRG